MNKTILVLAASRYQLPTIKTAKRLGYRVVTTDNMLANPGHALADKAYTVDTTDMSGVLQIAELERIDGVIAPCTDVAVPTAAYVAEKLGLVGVPYESAQICCDKIAFRQFLESEGLPAPKNLIVMPGYEPPEELFQDTWIIKPDRSSGSKGIFILQTVKDFHMHVAESRSFSPTGRVILERYIEGFQGTCEGILYQGKLAFAFVLDRQTVLPPYVTTCGHHLPSILPQELQKRLFSVLDRILRVMEITEGPFDCDFVVQKDEVFILEITPRIGGNAISALWSKAVGFDIVEYSVRQACRDLVSLPITTQIRPTAVILLGVSEEGRLVYRADEFEALQREAWVDELSIDVPIGEVVRPFINGRNRVGEAFVYGFDRADVDAKVIELRQRLDLRAVA